MQLLDVIFETARQVSLYRFVNVGHVRHHRADIGLLHAFIRACAHPARQQDFAISDCGHHTGVTVLGGGVKAVPARIRCVAVVFVLAGELVVPHFVTGFTRDDRPVLHGDDDIERRPAKVLTDSDAVFRNRCNLHQDTPLVHALAAQGMQTIRPSLIRA
jgi:hypothetical protein